jgi:hypothetical protein
LYNVSMALARKLFFVAALALALAGPAMAQNGLLSFTFTAVTSSSAIPNIGTGIGFHKMTWNVIGTAATCTVALDSSADGVTWTPGGAIVGQTCTSNGASAVTAGTFNYVRMTTTAFSCTGVCSVSVTWTGYVNSPGGGGTVSPNNGSAGAIANYAAAGGSTTVGPDATLVDNGAFLNYTGTGGYEAPNGTGSNPSICFAGDCASHVGFYRNTAGAVTWTPGGNANGFTTGNFFTRIAANYAFQFSNTNSDSTASADTGVSRAAADVIAIGNGGAGDESGLIRWNTCKPTSNITLSTSPTDVCSFSLPAVAKTWSWQCQGIYSITAGTSPTFSIGMNASQAPTSETGSAVLASTSSGATVTESSGTTTATAAGNQNIATTPAVTTITNGVWSSFGTIQASATAGTFAITATLGGTTPAGTVNVGTTCMLY